MNYEKVKEHFFLISDENKEDEQEERIELWEQFCQSAYREIQSAVKENLSREIYQSYQTDLEELAAAKAFYQLLLLEETKQADLIEDTHLKVVVREKSKKAKAFYEVCRRKAAAILKENAFFFGTTEYGEQDE